MIRRIAHNGSIRMPGNKRSPTHLPLYSESGASIAAHPARHMHSQKRRYLAEDGLTLREASPSLYEHVGYRDLQPQTRDYEEILLLLIPLLLIEIQYYYR